ncbi:hypothetical protein HKX48_001336 [Thoreauomyces humboldtii]|nr:hypothetical protein HKX48_001336 [Thoreauomyces humboldtii]
MLGAVVPPPPPPRPRKVHINDLPNETLLHVFSSLTFNKQVARLALVCSRWARLSRDVETLSIECTESVVRTGLHTILLRHPRLKRLEIVAARTGSTAIARERLALVARQFVGHPTLRIIVCPSDWIVPGAVDGCPCLEELVVAGVGDGDEVPVFADEDDEGEDGEDGVGIADAESGNATAASTHRELWKAPGLRRNLSWILNSVPSLTRVRIDDPHLWIRKKDMVTTLSLRELSLTSLSPSAILSLVDLLSPGGSRSDSDTDRTPALPHLRTMSLEIDYAFLPLAMFPALARGCPALTSLTLSTLEAPPGLVDAMAEGLKGLALTYLEFDKCSVWGPKEGWVSLVGRLCDAFPTLKTLRFGNCLYRVLPAATAHRRDWDAGDGNGNGSHGLEHIKIVPLCDTKLTTEDLASIVRDYPSLKTISVSAPAHTCTSVGIPVWLPPTTSASFNATLSNLRELTIRSGSIRELSAEPEESSQPIKLPSLTHLNLINCPLFPTLLVSCNPSHLTSLKLSYLPAHLPPTVTIPFPCLRTLVVRGVSHLGHKICIGTVTSLLQHAPRLTSLTVEAFHHHHRRSHSHDNDDDDDEGSSTLSFPSHVIHDLTVSCPDLVHLVIAGFRVRSLASLTPVASWPRLETLHMVGTKCLPVLTSEWEDEVLVPVLTNRRFLRSVRLQFEGIAAGGGSIEPTKGEDVLPYLARVERDRSTCEAYAMKLRKRFWWIEELVVARSSLMET